MELVLVQHGSLDADPRQCVGHAALPLSAEGFTAVQQLAATWEAAPPRFLMASDSRCAQQSAQIFAARFAIEPIADARLRGTDMGAWDGRLWDEIMRADASRYRHWVDNWVIQEVPGGESFADVLQRTGAWLAALLTSTRADDVVLAVTHAGPIRALLCHALGLPPAQANCLMLDNAQASAVRCRHGQFKVRYFNTPCFGTTPDPIP